MPNEVEETIRVLNTQLEEYNKKLKEASDALDEFSKCCEKTLQKVAFDYIFTLLYKLIKFYELKIDETSAAQKEILEKYEIPYSNKEG